MKRIAIFLSFALALSAFQMATTTKYAIQGKITDENGEALIGTNVLVKGTTNGTVTDIDGYFEVQSKDSCTTLVISYTGYENKEVQACSGKEVKVQLKAGETLFAINNPTLIQKTMITSSKIAS